MAMITKWQHATEASWIWVGGATRVSTPSWEILTKNVQNCIFYTKKLSHSKLVTVYPRKKIHSLYDGHDTER
jgi:hypothetical protein